MACPVCGSRKTSPIGENTLRGGVTVPIHTCASCDHKFCTSLPPPEVVQSWYQGITYFNMNCHHQGITTMEPSEQWNGFIGSRLKIFEETIGRQFGVTRKLKVCEIGCLEGAFIKHLSDYGHDVVGLEVNAEVASQAAAVNKIDIRCCDIETEMPAIDAEAVISFHTFEHLRNPLEATEKAYRILQPGGALLLELPCDDDEMNNPDHLHFFTEKSLRRMVSIYFDDAQIIPSSYLRGGAYRLDSLFAYGRKKKRPVRGNIGDRVRRLLYPSASLHYE